MKMNQFILLIIASLFFSSCALKVPAPQNSSTGILAIPVRVTNTTISKANFGFYFKIMSSINPDAVITIYPEVGEKFIFSEELPPGEYYFDKIKNILDMQVGRSTSNSDINTIPEIHVTIKPGAVTIADKRLIITMERSGPETYQSGWGVKKISDFEMSALIQEFRRFENSDKWSLVNEE